MTDGSGAQYPWAGVDVKPPLGKGTLKAGGKWGGNVTFRVPLQGALWVVFTGGDGQHHVPLPAQ